MCGIVGYTGERPCRELLLAGLENLEDAGDLVEATRRAYGELRGHYAFVAISRAQPELLVGARLECPLVVGRGDGENFIASAIPAFLAHTRRIQIVEDGDIV